MARVDSAPIQLGREVSRTRSFSTRYYNLFGPIGSCAVDLERSLTDCVPASPRARLDCSDSGTVPMLVRHHLEHNRDNLPASSSSCSTSSGLGSSEDASRKTWAEPPSDRRPWYLSRNARLMTTANVLLEPQRQNRTSGSSFSFHESFWNDGSADAVPWRHHCRQREQIQIMRYRGQSVLNNQKRHGRTIRSTMEHDPNNACMKRFLHARNAAQQQCSCGALGADIAEKSFSKVWRLASGVKNDIIVHHHGHADASVLSSA